MDVLRVMIVTLKFAESRAFVIGVPKLPEACGFGQSMGCEKEYDGNLRLE